MARSTPFTPTEKASMKELVDATFGPDYTAPHHTESEEQALFEKLRQAEAWWEEREIADAQRKAEIFDYICSELDKVKSTRDRMYAFSLFQDCFNLTTHTLPETYAMYIALGASARFADLDASTQEQVLRMLL